MPLISFVSQPGLSYKNPTAWLRSRLGSVPVAAGTQLFVATAKPVLPQAVAAVDLVSTRRTFAIPARHGSIARIAVRRSIYVNLLQYLFTLCYISYG